MILKFWILNIFLFIASSSSALSQELRYCAETVPDGVILESEKKRLISVYRQPVIFSDASGMRKARVIAQERAKSGMVRFFDEAQVSIRKVRAEDLDAGTSKRLIDANGDVVSSEFSRSQSEALIEIDSSIAAGDLRGLLQVEEYFDASARELCVAMGFSAKSNELRNEAKEWMTTPFSVNEAEAEVDNRGASKNTAQEYQRIRSDDW